MFDATFNNILIMLCHSVLLVKETRVSEECHRPATIHLQIFIT